MTLSACYESTFSFPINTAYPLTKARRLCHQQRLLSRVRSSYYHYIQQRGFANDQRMSTVAVVLPTSGPVITQLTLNHFVHGEGDCCVITLLSTSILSTRPLRSIHTSVLNLALTNHAFFNANDSCIQATKNHSYKTINQRLRRTSDAL